MSRRTNPPPSSIRDRRNPEEVLQTFASLWVNVDPEAP
ncbi:hypothetical protein GNI_132360, partial [Gregarina niphandrodes]